MRVTLIFGDIKSVEVEFVPLKVHEKFTCYQVSRIEKSGKLTPLYRECFTDCEIAEIKKNGNVIREPISGGLGK